MMKLPKLPLKIHCWGGLGSQLYALTFYFSVLRTGRFNTKLIFHSGGYTRRDPEISSLLPLDAYIVVDDFKSSSFRPNTQSGPKVRGALKSFVKSFLSFLKISLLHDPVSTVSIKPWTISIRGHYSSQNIEELDVLRVCDLLELRCSSQNNNATTMHMRTGDLLTVTSKAQVDLENYHSYISRFVALGKIKEDLKIFTESENIVREYFEINALSVPIEIYGRHVSTLELVKQCVQSGTFIGTNSKVSVWIAILRAALEKESSFLPSIFQMHLSRTLTQKYLSQISFY